MTFQADKYRILITFLLLIYFPTFGSDPFKTLYDSARSTKSVKIANMALTKALESNQDSLMAKSYYLLAYLQNSDSTYFESLSNYFSALDYYRQMGDQPIQEINIINNISIIYTNATLYGKAISFLEDGLTIANNTHQHTSTGHLHYNLGFNYRNKGNEQQAEDHYESALKYFQSQENILEMSRTYTELGLINLDNNNFAEAKRFYTLSVDILEDGSHDKKIAILKKSNSLGFMYMQEAKWDYAKQEFYSALQQAGTIKHHVLFDIYDNLAIIYKAEGLLDSATIVQERSVEYADKQHFDPDYLAAYGFLYDHYQTDPSRSRIYHDAISNFALNLAERQQQLEKGYKKYQVEAANFLREDTEREKELAKERLRHYLVDGGLVLFLFLAIYIAYRIYRKEAKRIKQTNIMLKKLKRANLRV